MAISGPRSGKHGAIKMGAAGATVIDAVRNWVLTESNTPEDQVHSASLSGHNRAPGVKDWTVNFEGFGGNPGFFPGDKVVVNLFTTPDTGVYGSPGMTYTGAGVVDSLTINWDWTPGGSLTYSGQVSANGCLTVNAAGDHVDTFDECKYQMCSLLPQYDADVCTTPNLVTWANVRSATLNITASNSSYSNSSTNCCTGREPGIIDWSLDITDEESNAILSNGAFYEFRLFTSATASWKLKYGIMVGRSNLNVDIQTGAIISKDNNIMMAGQICCPTDTPTQGSIINPSDVTKWPINAV